jgi:TolB-like protein
MTLWATEIKELESLYTSIKGRFPELGKDLEHLIKTDDENVALLYSRRCLEIIVTDLCESELKRPRKTDPLKGIIDKLHREEKVPSHIITSMDHLNSIATFGTHPKDFDPEQVKPVLNNLSIIIKWYVKYKDTQIIGQAKPEETKVESKEPVDIEKGINKPKKKLILLLSGLLLVAAIVVVILFVFNIISGDKQTKELEKSIAVLPFENMSDNEEYSWFGDAMTDEIIMQLYKIKDFIVRSRTSVMQYKGTVKTIPVISHELSVNYLIEGSAQRIEDQVRIRVQLINATTDDHLWGDTFEGEWKNILSLQSEIAKQIAIKLKTILSPEEIANIQKVSTKNLEAYDLYLLGMHYYNNFSHDSDLWKTIEYFQLALDKDTTFALAYAGLADTYRVLYSYNLLAPNEIAPKVKAYAMKALELNEELANAHCSMGDVKLWFEYDPDGAEKEYVRAIEINPNSSNAHFSYAYYLLLKERYDEAISHANYSLELDPLSNVIKQRKINVLFRAGFREEALQLAEDARDSDPTWFYWFWLCATFYTELGMYNEAVSMLENEISLMENDNISDELGLLGYVYGKLGQRDKAQTQLDLLNELSSRGIYISSMALCKVYLGLENFEKAIEFLEKGVDDHSVDLLRLKSSNIYDPLRDDPRFNELINRIGL